MYNSYISIDDKGTIVANTEYNGRVAFYLKNNNDFIEKKGYAIQKSYSFKEKPLFGVVSIKFFFEEKEGKISTYESDFYLYDLKKLSFEKIVGQVLKEDQDYRITYYDRDSNITFITFNGTNTTKNKIPFGINFTIKNNWNLISVAQDNDTQYQSLSLEEFYEAVKPVIVNKDVYSYGSSLGGYCALYFGGCVDATIIAASPKNSAHHSINMARFKNLTFKHKCFSNIPTTSKEVYIVYDSTIRSDSKFINEYISLAYLSPKLLPIEHGTHMVLQTMLKAGVLKLYVNSIVDKNYSQDISNYIMAKCKYSQGKSKEAFNILEDMVKDKIKL